MKIKKKPDKYILRDERGKCLELMELTKQEKDQETLLDEIIERLIDYFNILGKVWKDLNEI